MQDQSFEPFAVRLLVTNDDSHERRQLVVCADVSAVNLSPELRKTELQAAFDAADMQSRPRTAHRPTGKSDFRSGDNPR